MPDQGDHGPRTEASSDVYRTLVELVADVIYALGPDGTLTALSPAFAVLTGWSVDDWLGRSFAGLLHPDDLLSSWERVQQVMQGEVPPPAQLRIRTRSGEFLWGEFLSAPIVEQGQIVGEVGVARDITARKRSEEQAQIVHSILAAAAGQQDLSRILAETLDRLGRTVDFTGGSIALVEGDELVIRAAVGPFAKPALGQRLRRGPSLSWRIVESGQPVLIGDLSVEGYRTFSGEDGRGLRSYLAVPLVWRDQPFGMLEVDSTEASAFHQADLELLQAVAVALNGPIELARRLAGETEARKEAEAAQGQLARLAGLASTLALENARLFAEAQQAVQLREEFLSVAAHELKTPITALRGYAQLVLRQLQRSEVLDPLLLQRAFLAVDSQSDKLSQLVSQLLDVARIEAGKLPLDRLPTDLRALVESAVETARARTNHHTLSVRATGPLIAHVDPLRLEQVLTNLLDNAIKYSPEGGEVVVELSCTSGAMAQLAVIDRGMGIAPEHRQRIFDRFYQAHAGHAAQGMGLGLYVSRQIVELHGGEMQAEFPPEGGTTIEVRLPLHHNAPAVQ